MKYPRKCTELINLCMELRSEIVDNVQDKKIE